MDLIRSTRGLSAKVARELGITTAAVAHWRVVPAERVPAVERASGIPRHLLRPDLWDVPTQSLQAHEARQVNLARVDGSGVERAGEAA
jgi:DNA-binding transcriptional regulator YdaS (Cro superfamily)